MAQAIVTVNYPSEVDNASLFSFSVSHEAMVDKALQQSIERHWDSFQGTHPDADSQFMEYLVERGYEVADPAPQTIVLVG